MTRTEEILKAVDGLIRVHDEWEADSTGPDVPTALFENSLLAAVEVCEVGDTPKQCREVVDAAARLGLEWERYRNGHMRTDHRPVGSLWGAFRALVLAREGATPLVVCKREPVALLLKQGVSRRQIALYNYGDGTHGPLVAANGLPDDDKINREAEEPGSVIPDDWVHPDDVERIAKHHQDMEKRLESIAQNEDAEVQYDPASIEELLREGQFPHVVAKVKGVGMDEVQEVVDRLLDEGVTPSEVPTLASEHVPSEPVIPPGAASAETGEAISSADTPDEPTEIAAIEDLIIELAGENPDLGAGELVKKINEDLGEHVSVQKVAGVLRKHSAGAA